MVPRGTTKAIYAPSVTVQSRSTLRVPQSAGACFQVVCCESICVQTVTPVSEPVSCCFRFLVNSWFLVRSGKEFVVVG
jgi:hypothetical protein